MRTVVPLPHQILPEIGKWFEVGFEQAFNNLTFDGEWHPFFDGLEKIYAAHTSVRGLVASEHALQGFFKTFLSLADYYELVPNLEMNHGYSDFFPKLKKYPDITHSYLIDLKYTKKEAPAIEIEALRQEAIKTD